MAGPQPLEGGGLLTLAAPLLAVLLLSWAGPSPVAPGTERSRHAAPSQAVPIPVVDLEAARHAASRLML